MQGFHFISDFISFRKPSTAEPLILSPELFITATSEMIDGLLAERCNHDGLYGLHAHEASWPGTLNASERRRLQTHLKHAKDLQLCTDVAVHCEVGEDEGNDTEIAWRAPVCLACLNHEPGFTGLHLDSLPRPTRGALVHDLVKQRLLTPEEL